MWGQLSKITQYTREVIAEGLASGEESDDSEESGQDYVPNTVESIVPRDFNPEVLNTLKAERDSFKKQLAESERKNMTVVKEFNNLLHDKETEIVALKKQLNEEQLRNEKTQKDQEKINLKLQEQVTFLQTKLINSVNEPSQQTSSETTEAPNRETEESSEPVLQEEIENLLKKQKIHEEVISALKKQISDDQEQITDLKSHLQEENLKAKLQAEEMDSLIKSNFQLQRNHEEVVSSLNYQVKTNEDLIITLQDELQNERKKVLEISSQKQTLPQDYVNLKTQLENLQNYMDQMQTDQMNEVEIRTFQLKQQVQTLTKDLAEKEFQLQGVQEIQSQNQKLITEIKEKDAKLVFQAAEIGRLEEDYQPLNTALQRALAKLNEQLQDGQNLIDKRIVSKLFVTYHTDPAQRAAILNIMSGILHFSTEEQKAVGLIQDTSIVPSNSRFGWIKDWWSRSSVPTTAAQQFMKQSEKHVKSLSELWVEFLLQEAQSTIETEQNPQNMAETELASSTSQMPPTPSTPKPISIKNYTVQPAVTPTSTPAKPALPGPSLAEKGKPLPVTDDKQRF